MEAHRQDRRAIYPAEGGVGRPPVGVERMLRMYFLQHWFNLSDPAVEEALYESNSMRAFVGIDLGRERVPDETTVCKFRHLLEKHRLGKRIFKAINTHLAQPGMTVGRGTIVDATIIHAPSSTKNKDEKRDPEMHSTQKGNQWFFGMKAHIGVDSKTGLVHSLVTTAPIFTIANRSRTCCTVPRHVFGVIRHTWVRRTRSRSALPGRRTLRISGLVVTIHSAMLRRLRIA